MLWRADVPEKISWLHHMGIILLILPVMVSAQSFRGSIRGKVADAIGGLVQGA